MSKEKLGKREFNDDLTDIWFKLGIVFGVFLIAMVPVFYIFGTLLTESGIDCAFQVVTHLYCPGCGGTRSFYQLVHGHIFKSIILNPFVPYTVIDYIVFMINTILVKSTKKAGFEGFPVTITIYVGLGILFGSWIIRNIIYLVFGLTCL